MSKNGGLTPQWRSDGKELIFLNLERTQMMSVSVDARRTFRADSPVALLAVPPGVIGLSASGDLKRFLFSVPGVTRAPQSFNVLLNWTALLKSAR